MHTTDEFLWGGLRTRLERMGAYARARSGWSPSAGHRDGLRPDALPARGAGTPATRRGGRRGTRALTPSPPGVSHVRSHLGPSDQGRADPGLQALESSWAANRIAATATTLPRSSRLSARRGRPGDPRGGLERVPSSRWADNTPDLVHRRDGRASESSTGVALPGLQDRRPPSVFDGWGRDGRWAGARRSAPERCRRALAELSRGALRGARSAHQSSPPWPLPRLLLRSFPFPFSFPFSVSPSPPSPVSLSTSPSTSSV